MKIVINVGRIDQVMRLVLSALMIFFGFFSNALIVDDIAGILLGSFGIFIFLTAIFRYCPLYLLIGFDSNRKKKELNN